MKKTLREIHEDVSAEHYDKGISSNIFQRYWHNKRFREVAKEIIPVKGKILDIGCHGGLFTKVVLNACGAKEVYGIDISRQAIKRAERRIKKGKFLVADIHKLPFKRNTFDAVFCLEVFEHIKDARKALREISRVLKGSGYCLILVPTDNRLFKIIWFLWNTYYPVWKHAHIQSFTNTKLEKMIQKTGFKIQNVRTFNLGMLKLVSFKKQINRPKTYAKAK